MIAYLDSAKAVAEASAVLIGRLTLGVAAAFAAATAQAGQVRYDYTLRSALEAYGGKPEAGLSNPDNAVMALPSAKTVEELRPNVSVERGPLRLELRPRLHARQHWQTVAGRRSYTAEKVDIYWNYATVAARLGSAVDVVYGLENYQWGPGELISPSNPLTREQILNQVGFYEAPGQHQLRVNASLGQSVSVVFEFRPSFAILRREASRQAALTKVEYKGSNGRWYLGTTATAVHQAKPQWGAYGQYEVLDSTFLYTDAVRQGENTTLYPDAGPPLGGYAPVRRDQAAVNALYGMRYSAAGGTDLRLEYLHQDSGYNRRDWRRQRALLAAAPPSFEPVLAAASLQPGPLLTAAESVYLSLRLPDIGPNKLWTVYSRTLTTLSDPSAFTTLGAQWNANDHLQWLLEGHAAIGKKDRDLTRSYRDLFNVGLLLTL